MAKRSVRDMLKARAWKRQVSLAVVDPGDHLAGKRRKIAAAREKYGPELLDLQERLFAEKKQAILIVLQGLDTSGKAGTAPSSVSPERQFKSILWLPSPRFQ